MLFCTKTSRDKGIKLKSISAIHFIKRRVLHNDVNKKKMLVYLYAF